MAFTGSMGCEQLAHMDMDLYDFRFSWIFDDNNDRAVYFSDSGRVPFCNVNIRWVSIWVVQQPHVTLQASVARTPCVLKARRGEALYCFLTKKSAAK